MKCNEIQERLARGRSLSPEQNEHAASCPHCLKVATSYSLLDEALDALAPDVPEDFTDRVMDDVRREGYRSTRVWLGARSIQLALVYGGAVIALLNVLRFLAGILVPNVGLGVTP